MRAAHAALALGLLLVLGDLQRGAARSARRNRKKSERPQQWCTTQPPVPQPAPAVAAAVARAVCDHIGRQPPPRRLSLGRWTPEVDAALGPAAKAVTDALRGVSVLQTVGGGAMPWLLLKVWLDHIASESEAFEIRALSAPIHEQLWYEVATSYGVLGTVVLANAAGADVGFDDDNAKLSAMPAQTLLAYKQAGRLDEAQRCFQRMLDFEEGKGSYPFRFFYDTSDVQRMGAYPWHGLRPLTWPKPSDVLPDGVTDALIHGHPQIAVEASQVVSSGAIDAAGDAYPLIAGGNQWTKLVLCASGQP